MDNLLEIRNKEDIARLDWAIRIIPKKEKRQFLTFLHVSGGMVVGCDGHRMHCVLIDTIPDGTYLLKTKSKTLLTLLPVEGITRPSSFFDHLAPSKEATEVKLDAPYSSWSRENDSGLVWRMIELLSGLSESRLAFKTGYQYGYLSDALRCYEGNTTRIFVDKDSMWIRTNYCIAKIMATRI